MVPSVHLDRQVWHFIRLQHPVRKPLYSLPCLIRRDSTRDVQLHHEDFHIYFTDHGPDGGASSCHSLLHSQPDWRRYRLGHPDDGRD